MAGQKENAGKGTKPTGTIDLLVSKLLVTMIAATIKKGKANVLGDPDIKNEECESSPE